MDSSLPGRLGSPDMSLTTDPRTHPRLLAALEERHLADLSYLTTVLAPDAPVADSVAFVLANEAAIEGLYGRLDYSVPESIVPAVKVETTEEHISGPNGGRLRLVIRRPAGHREPLPAVVYLHGGGMVILSTDCRMHATWADALTRTGLVTVTVDFRNALDPSQPGRVVHPFPAGLDDCCAAVRWVHENRAVLGLTGLVLQGESGGANLAIAVALRAKRENWLGAVQGVCASVPYISNAYGLPAAWRRAHLPSLVECDGYLISCATSVQNARLYDPSGAHARDPLAWPFWAAETDLAGLPPHLVVVNELDPLRDEGIDYYRRLLRAGVRAVGRVNLGMIHEGELFFRSVVPEVFGECLWEISRFVRAAVE